jgi:hypothetical protein
MAFEARGFIQNAQRLPAQVEQPVGNDDAGGERGALDPRPLPRGIWLWMRRSMGGMVMRMSRATASAVCQIRLSTPVEILSASRPSASIESCRLWRKRHSK